jgi:hypothetical protein
MGGLIWLKYDICLKYQGKSPLNYQYAEQESKTDPIQGRYQGEGGGHKKMVIKSEQGGCILYSCMKIEQWKVKTVLKEKNKGGPI